MIPSALLNWDKMNKFCMFPTIEKCANYQNQG